MKKPKLRNLVLSALFVALGYILPYLTMQIPTLGKMLLPMHIPVLLSGFVCGAPWGLVVGVVTPVLRSLIAGMPQLFPVAAAMAFELGTYGLLAGLFYKILPKKAVHIYTSLVLAMLGGRLVWGLVMFLFTGIKGGAFSAMAFLEGAFLGAIPGIILQIVLIPLIVMGLKRAGVIKK